MGLPPHLDGHSSEYENWRQKRLTESSTTGPPAVALTIEAAQSQQPMAPDPAFNADALRCMVRQIRVHGFARYRLGDEAGVSERRQQLARLATALGLRRADPGIIADDDTLTLLEHQPGSPLARFPPYSDRTLNWHTDGYYSAMDQEVRAFLLHCLQPASEGGELTLLDPELLLIALYDQDPTLVDRLTAPDAMTVPGNTDEQGHRRPDTTVPVIFAYNDKALGMRFTTRSRNIRWKNEQTHAASQKVSAIIDELAPKHVRLRLNRNEGIVCRNLLHRRGRYRDAASAKRRQILRGRYLDAPKAL